MPPAKYNTDEERKEAHRAAALKYARKNMSVIIAYNKQRYIQNRDAINATRREKYAAKKALIV
jgi:hypothetical protein